MDAILTLINNLQTTGGGRMGDMLVVEPGEAHTFVSSSDDYLHFVVQTPFVKGDKVDVDD